MIHYARKQEASFTVEAALILPIIFLTCYTFLFFFYVIEVQEQIHYASGRACESIASMGYVVRYISNSRHVENIKEQGEVQTKENENFIDISEEDLKKLLFNLTDAVIIKEYVKTHIKDRDLIDKVVLGGWDGVSFYGSNLLDEEGFVTIFMSYKIEFPMIEHVIPGFPVVQCVRMHSFKGREVDTNEDEQEGNMVYVAETGTVYHTHENCSYIKIVLRPVVYQQISALRNDGGGKYYSCESCISSHVLEQIKSENAGVYITSDGARYHSTTNCRSIKRNVKKVRMEEVEGKQKCSKCTARDGQ